MQKTPRKAVSLIELMAVFAITSVLLVLLISAIQKARAAAIRTECLNNLKQIGLALHQFHDAFGKLPPGVSIQAPGDGFPHLSWRIRLTPFLDQQSLWSETVREYQVNPYPNLPPYHAVAGKVIPLFTCNSDWRVADTQRYGPFQIALSSYLASSGIDYMRRDGLFYADSQIKFVHIIDGMSNTLAVGERPPSNNLRYGWLYFGVGQSFSGSLDHVLGANEIATSGTGCPTGTYYFKQAQLGVPCAFMHYWSLHDGGANFLFADGSARLLGYDAAGVLPALATRYGAEPVVAP